MFAIIFISLNETRISHNQNLKSFRHFSFFRRKYFYFAYKFPKTFPQKFFRIDINSTTVLNVIENMTCLIIYNTRIFSYILLIISNFYKVIMKNLECMNTFLIYLCKWFIFYLIASVTRAIWLYLTHYIFLFSSIACQ